MPVNNEIGLAVQYFLRKVADKTPVYSIASKSFVDGEGAYAMVYDDDRFAAESSLLFYRLEDVASRPLVNLVDIDRADTSRGVVRSVVKYFTIV